MLCSDPSSYGTCIAGRKGREENGEEEEKGVTNKSWKLASQEWTDGWSLFVLDCLLVVVDLVKNESVRDVLVLVGCQYGVGNV